MLSLLLLAIASLASAQTFQRLGTCPSFGCVLPPTQTDFLAGAYFDIRLEVHAPANGSEAGKTPSTPDDKFTFSIQKDNGKPVDAAKFFGVQDPTVEKWNFTWYEDLFAKDAKTPSLVNVAAKAYRKVSFNQSGTYTAVLSYYNGSNTTAQWTVRQASQNAKAKNVLLFIGDGMTTAMISAARLIGHKAINGRFQSLMQMDQMDALGHSMTHSIDSFITDSANSATALYSGHKSTVNSLGVYADSSKTPFDDPKVENIAELFHRKRGGSVGIVSTAFIADATPGALAAHTRDRNQYGNVIDSYLNGITNYTWTNFSGAVDVLFGGGAENFLPGASFQNKNYYDLFKNAGYSVAYNKTQLQQTSNSSKTLGIFSVSNMAKWLDRNVYTNNLKNQSNSPTGDKTDAVDQPGLKDMTIKAIDILQERSKSHGKGWFMMSEAASIDKMMHVLDYDRALGELLELDDTIRASMDHLKAIGELENTLIIVTADHGHGFDVTGSVDTKYLQSQNDDRKKRAAIGVYQNSGLSQYQVLPNTSATDQGVVYGSQGPNFPVQWDPRYTYMAGFGANPDHREDYAVHKNGPRLPAVNITPAADYYVNPKDSPNGFLVNGTLSVDEAQGVHSLSDVPVFASGPGNEVFRGVYNNIEIFYKMADALGLGGN